MEKDMECQLLRPSTDVDRVFAGGSPVVLQTGGISDNQLSCLYNLDVAEYLSSHAIRPWTEELTGKG